MVLIRLNAKMTLTRHCSQAYLTVLQAEENIMTSLFIESVDEFVNTILMTEHQEKHFKDFLKISFVDN